MGSTLKQKSTSSFGLRLYSSYQYCAGNFFTLHLHFNCKVHRGTTDFFTTIVLHFSLFSTALWDMANSRPVHSLTSSSHLFLCLPCLLPPFTVPCKMILARLDEWETCQHCFSLHLFMMVRRSSCGPVACWILAQMSSLVNGLFIGCIVSCRST